jgi:hypothetical protein
VRRGREKSTSKFLLAACFMLVSCLPYFLALKMVAICSSETLVDCTTWCYMAEGRTLYSHLCDNLKSNMTTLHLIFGKKKHLNGMYPSTALPISFKHGGMR